MIMNSLQYTGIAPECDMSDNPSPLADSSPLDISRSQNFELSANRSRGKFLDSCIGSNFTLLVLLGIPIYVLLGRAFTKTSSYGVETDLVNFTASTSANSIFDRKLLSPLSSTGSFSSHMTGGISSSAILLYKYEKSDEIYGHIPYAAVDSEEPYLMVDQITKGVGKWCWHGHGFLDAFIDIGDQSPGCYLCGLIIGPIGDKLFFA